jgi:peptidyl-tRNA hydrolase, PTH1 family
LLVLGLGNPGTRYRETRHNVGFHVADKIAVDRGTGFKKSFLKPYDISRATAQDTNLWIVKPLTFMNNSGVAARRAMRSLRIEVTNMLVVCDNLDLPPGTCRLKKGGSDAGHNGLKSIIKHIGTGDFLRLYVGIGRPGKKSTVVDWVLGEPEKHDADLIDAAVTLAAAGAQMLLTQAVDQVMNELNSKSRK